jgi:hypothetical protein
MNNIKSINQYQQSKSQPLTFFIASEPADVFAEVLKQGLIYQFIKRHVFIPFKDGNFYGFQGYPRRNGRLRPGVISTSLSQRILASCVLNPNDPFRLTFFGESAMDTFFKNAMRSAAV